MADPAKEMIDVTSQTITDPHITAEGSDPGPSLTEHHLVVTVRTRSVIAKDVIVLELASASTLPLPAWEPGAFINMLRPAARVQRYPLCGSPAKTNSRRIAVPETDDGARGPGWIHDHAHPGMELRIRGSHSGLPLKSSPDYLLVAYGTAPLFPMITRFEAHGSDRSLLLLFSGQSQASMVFLPSLLAYREPVVVRAEDRYGPPGLTGFLGDPAPFTLVHRSSPQELLTAVREYSNRSRANKELDAMKPLGQGATRECA